MPTGYTSEIYEGKDMTGGEFLLKCARAFGATVSMRDEPLDKEIPEFETSDYYPKMILRTEQELAKAQSISEDYLQTIIDEQFEKEVADYYKKIDEKNSLKERYMSVLREVEEWKPPTDEHKELKRFAIDQLHESIDFDCGTEYIKYPEKQTPSDYKAFKIKCLEKDLVYYKKEYKAEVERINGQNSWVKSLKESINK